MFISGKGREVFLNLLVVGRLQPLVAVSGACLCAVAQRIKILHLEIIRNNIIFHPISTFSGFEYFFTK